MNAEGKKDGKGRRITTAQPRETQENRKRKRAARASGCVRKMRRRINDGGARETGGRRSEKDTSGALVKVSFKDMRGSNQGEKMRKRAAATKTKHRKAAEVID